MVSVIVLLALIGIRCICLLPTGIVLQTIQLLWHCYMVGEVIDSYILGILVCVCVFI